MHRKSFHCAPFDCGIEFQKIDALQYRIQSFCSLDKSIIIQLCFHTATKQDPPAFNFKKFTGNKPWKSLDVVKCHFSEQKMPEQY